MNVNLGGDFVPVMICYALASFVLTAVVHVMFTVGVWTATSARPTELVPPWVWIVATLLGGPLVAAAYWVVHMSAIARPLIREPHQDVRSYDAPDGRPQI